MKRWIQLGLGMLLVLAMCSCEGATEGDDLERRGAAGKYDRFGSCAGSDCSGQSPTGNCWCDDECESYGDCCEDRAAVCDSAPPVNVDVADGEADSSDSGQDSSGGETTDSADAHDGALDGDTQSETQAGGCAPVPEKLHVGGRPSAVAVADFDADGCSDLATLVADQQWLSLVVVWGDGQWQHRWVQPIAQIAYPSTRDSSSAVLVVGDWNNDGHLDVLTSTGVALGAPGRALSWQPMEAATTKVLFPVGLVDLEGEGSLELVRGSVDGRLERCSALDSCQFLATAEGFTEPVLDLAVGDFDHDGRPDLLAGDYFTSWLWRSSTGWSTPVKFDEMHAVDFEVGDVNGDGHPDVVAQRMEFISDFPSYTDVWISQPTGFDRIQTLYNHDNHNDAAALVDIDNDGCLDYLQHGVDIPAAGLRWGDCQFLGEHDPTRDVDVGWAEVPTISPGIGVQCLDIDGDSQCELVVRRAWTAGSDEGLYFFPPPAHVD